jgi:uncharacterized protein YndB with AHSA1/START domain
MTPKTKAYELEMERTLKAPVTKVWDALTKGEAVGRWYGPTDEFQTEVLEWDLRVGGKYRITMHAPDGNAHTCHGIFREIAPMKKVSYTWSWEGQDPMESLVAFEISEEGGQTLLQFSHTGLPTEDSREHHQQGWMGCIGRLEKLLSA